MHHLCDYSLKTLIATTDGFIPPLWPITLNLYSISQAHRGKRVDLLDYRFLLSALCILFLLSTFVIKHIHSPAVFRVRFGKANGPDHL